MTCAVWGRGSLARHGTARPGLAWHRPASGQPHSGRCTQTEGQGGEDSESPVSPGLQRGEDRDVPGPGMSRAGSASCPAPVSAAPVLSPASASSPQSSQRQRGWSPPSSRSPRGWLLLPPFLPRPNQPPCCPPSKKCGCAHGWPWRGAGTSLAVPLLTSAVPRPGDPQPSTSAAVEWGRAGDPGRLQGPCRGLQGWPGPAQHQGLIPVLSLADANGFNTVPVTTARLSHPTATRPRVPGQRPPSMVLGSTGGPHGGEQPQGLPRAALCAPVPSTGQAPVPPWSTEGLEVLEGRSLALEDLKAEVRTLHILVDLMRVQHLRDLQDLRQELCQEQAQRQALQVSPCQGLPRPGVPCAPQQSQPLPTGGDRASEEGAALLAWGGCGAHPWHGAGGWHMALCAPPAWFCTRWIQMPTPHPGTAP
ncbi:uncharacterized protein [Taeniopygia guttata]|uniref:uncharacterized protein isoform X1 n=1 Tax=Taeniopygia guttata TaxID=59729 RepID=UPI003BB92656